MCNLLRFILYVRANPKYKSPGLIFGGAYIRRVFYVSNLGAYIRMGLYLKGLIFGGVYIRRGLYLEGLIFGILRYGTKRKKCLRLDSNL